MHKLVFRLFLVALLLGLQGCGDDNQLLADGTTTTDTSTDGDDGAGSDDSTSTVAPVKVLMGYIDTDGDFNDGEVGVGTTTTLSAGGATTLKVVFVDDTTGTVITELAPTVNFSSTCLANGLATIDTPVVATAGVATASYVALGCEGDDPITVTSSVSTTDSLTGGNYKATGSVSVAAATLGSVKFVSATPKTITVKGTGGTGQSETSTVIFQVLNSVGGPVPNQTVAFTLDNSRGGTVLNPTSGVTGSDGTVQTVVKAGTVPNPIKVTATTSKTVSGVTTTISSQSDQLAIVTGPPDQDSFTISATNLNPEAWNYNGVEVTLTAQLGDHANNPVTDGTTVQFTTEGGTVVGTCTTASGACSAKWTSSLPRPQADGRVTILARAVGEESFKDANNNGHFDATDLATHDYFDDLPEAFRDDNEDGVFTNSGTATQEEFFDFDNDGVYDAADGNYTGSYCDPLVDLVCSTTRTLHVRQSIVLVMSGSSAFNDGFLVDSSGDGSVTIAEKVASLNISGTGTTAGCNVGSCVFYVQIHDLHNQPMPSGTTVTATTDEGLVLKGTTIYTVPSTNYNGPLQYGFIVTPDDTDPKNGAVYITVKTPGAVGFGGTVSTFSIFVTVP